MAGVLRIETSWRVVFLNKSNLGRFPKIFLNFQIFKLIETSKFGILKFLKSKVGRVAHHTKALKNSNLFLYLQFFHLSYKHYSKDDIHIITELKDVILTVFNYV